MTMTLPDFDKALYTKLKSSTAVTSLVGGTVAPKIYNMQAPDGVELPYIVFYHASGGADNVTPRGEYTVTYRVDTFGNNSEVCYNISKACFDCLHNNDVPLTGYSNFVTRVGQFQSFIENDEGEQYWRKLFDVRLQYTIG